MFILDVTQDAHFRCYVFLSTEPEKGVSQSISFYSNKFKSSREPGRSSFEVTLLVGYTEGGMERGNPYEGDIEGNI